MPRSLNTARGAFKKPQDGNNPRKQLDSSRVRRMTAPAVRREPAPEQSEENESAEEEPVEEEPVEEEPVKEEPQSPIAARGPVSKFPGGVNPRKQLDSSRVRRMTAPRVRREPAPEPSEEDESEEEEPIKGESPPVKEENSSPIPAAPRGPVSKFPGGVNPRKQLDSSRVQRKTAPRVRPQPAPEPSEEDESMEDAPEEDEPEDEESEEEESPSKKRGDPSGCKPGGGKRKRDDSDDDDDDRGNGSDNDEDDDNAGDRRPRKKARAAPTKRYNTKRVPTTRGNRRAAELSKQHIAEGGPAVQARRVEDWNPKKPGDLEWTVRGIIGEKVSAKGKVEYLIDWEPTGGHEWDPTWEPVEMLAKDRDQTIAAWEVLKFAKARAEAEALAESKMDLDVFEVSDNKSKKRAYPEKQHEALFHRNTRAGRKLNAV